MAKLSNDDLLRQIELAIEDDSFLAECMETLTAAPRLERQRISQVIGGVANAKPEALLPYIDVILNAVKMPEAQTRWEAFEVLTKLVAYDSRSCEKALPDAEASLFDESSGLARLSAMRFLCRLGSTTEVRSKKTWPLIDEAVQCYHGDLEFQDMLIALIEFSAGTLDSEVKAQLVERMSFDAANAKGALKRRATQIINNVSK